MNSIEQVKLDEAKAKAKKEVKKENNVLFVTSLLNQTSFPVPRIALLVGVSEAYVAKVKASLKK
jgi:adenine-specific DNA methylase